jgi:hypothetical protein
VTTATLRLGPNRYPVVLPSLRDPRLHLAAVILSIHLLGQLGLGFRVSVPQILAAILTAALIEMTLRFARTGQLVWPASGLLTGSGVALILRLVGVEGDPWTWRGWHLFALVAAVSVLSKYLLRYRGAHLFNPSNLGLVGAFLVLGGARAEPLDFWWGPLDGWLAAAYLIILSGGLIITGRLRLLPMALTFWLTLAAGLGLMATSGHCITAAWSLGPVCDASFWWVVVTSPELLIFLFFMITDPRTIPTGAPARIVFGAALGILSTLLIAPMTTEFGAKVALLGGLVLLTPVRHAFDRALGGEGGLLARLAGPVLRPSHVFLRGAVAGAGLVLLGAGVVVAAAPARGTAEEGPVPQAPVIEGKIDPSLLPSVSFNDPGTLRVALDELDPDGLALALAENLEIERQALLKGDQRLLLAADVGKRLAEMERRIDEAAAAEERVVSEFSFDSLSLEISFPNGPQGGPSLALQGRGSVEEITYDLGGTERARTAYEFDSTFILRRGGNGWLIAEVLPGQPG